VRVSDFQHPSRSGIDADPRVLEAVGRIDRQQFVDPSLRTLAYEEYPLPIGSDQTISSVETVIRLCSALSLTGGERVLEIGTGSGYQAAVLAELGCRVYTIEKIAELSRTARRLLDKLGYQSILIRWGDGGDGWPQYAPFTRVVVTAACPCVPSALLEQLSKDGILVVPVGPPGDQFLIRLRKPNGQRLVTERLEKCKFVPLVGRSGWSRDELSRLWPTLEAENEG
jgi:protein-L-isoaspartate(D-aspartate) O-methyltransferase